MAKEKRKRKSTKPSVRSAAPASLNSPATEAATIAWTVSVTMVVVCDVIAIGAHLYFLQNPQAKNAAMLGGLMLLAGAIIGVGVLALTPVVYRLRREPPPAGYAAFAACAAAAPIVAVVARMLQ